MSDKYILLELKSFMNTMNRHLDSFTRNHGLNRMQFLTIVYLLEHQDQKIYQKDIEKEFDIRRSTATIILTKLICNHYINRFTQKDDARLKQLVLTDKAIAIAKNFEKSMVEFNQKIENGISDEQKEILFGIISKMKSNLN